MSSFTICDSLLEHSSLPENVDFYCDVLFKFTQSNRYKVCIDNNSLIQDRYIDICKDKENLRFWLQIMLSRKRKFEIIQISKKGFSSHQELYIEVASKTFGSKKLVTSSKQNYIAYEKTITKNNIELLDNEEIKEVFSTNLMKIKAKASKKGQISLGNNSTNLL